MTDVADTEQILRLVQSIPSPKNRTAIGNQLIYKEIAINILIKIRSVKVVNNPRGTIKEKKCIDIYGNILYFNGSELLETMHISGLMCNNKSILLLLAWREPMQVCISGGNMKLKKIVTGIVAATMAVALTGCSAVKLTGVEIGEIPVLKVGQTHELTAAFIADKEDADTAAIEEAAKKLEIVWESSDEKIATVDENGVVTAIGEGEAEITVKTGDFTAGTKVTVMAEEETIDEGAENEELQPEEQEPKETSSAQDNSKNNNATGTASGNVNGGKDNTQQTTKPEQPAPAPAPQEPAAPQTPPAEQPSQPTPPPVQPEQPAPQPDQPSGGGSINAGDLVVTPHEPGPSPETEIIY